MAAHHISYRDYRAKNVFINCLSIYKKCIVICKWHNQKQELRDMALPPPHRWLQKFLFYPHDIHYGPTRPVHFCHRPTARIPMDLLSLSFTLCFGMRRGRGARNHRLSTGSHGIRTVSYPYPKLRIAVAQAWLADYLGRAPDSLISLPHVVWTSALALEIPEIKPPLGVETLLLQPQWYREWHTF